MSDLMQELEEARTPAPANPLDRCINWLGRQLSLLFILVVVISFYEVAMRYVFNSPTIWVHETATFIGAALFVVGGLYAFANDQHVRVVVIYDAVGPKVRAWLKLLHHLLGLSFCGMMIYGSWFMAQKAWFAPWGDLRLESSGSAWNPHFPAYLKGLIFAAFCILAVQMILHLIRDLRRLFAINNPSAKETSEDV
ncbi:TRAP-type mannitol/chloroaromatic compound transport system, small permease component [Hahella chejuensis KCTC 2396]|uniref:TRAP transporter small permease protein n=1 Tax=Hahella chejuensis (strain KCTC 2396) TaxID=349521 RepID=Q2SGE1_HAHCH|nr:TRAP transporter small permease subunit [Hahella chejuensis]ABC30283.1 TRAP-type mannitol/chloroaromatic compound transport system, small permease component [Hahella chejuensis KCTC 2396]